MKFKSNRNKSVDVIAVRVTINNYSELERFLAGTRYLLSIRPTPLGGKIVVEERPLGYFSVLNRTFTIATDGDWLVKLNGFISTYSDKEFKQTFTQIGDRQNV